MVAAADRLAPRRRAIERSSNAVVLRLLFLSGQPGETAGDGIRYAEIRVL